MRVDSKAVQEGVNRHPDAMSKSDPATTVLITGAMGFYGKQMTARLATRPGWTVIASDMKPPPVDAETAEKAWGPAHANVRFVQVDLAEPTNVPIIEDMVGRCHYVIHLGSYPGSKMLQSPAGISVGRNLTEVFETLGSKVEFWPDQSAAEANYAYYQGVSPQQLLRDNVQGCQSVFEAAIKHRVKRMLFASSAFAYGWAHDGEDFTPEYLPMDELHPLTSLEHYGLSKAMSEINLDMLLRAGGIGNSLKRLWEDGGGTSVVSMRWPNTPWNPYWYDGSLPWKTPKKYTIQGGPIIWAYISQDDVVEGFIRAMDIDEKHLASKHEVFVLSADDVRFDSPTMDLITRHWKGRTAPNITRPLPGFSSILNNDKAKRVLGMKFRTFRDMDDVRARAHEAHSPHGQFIKLEL
eukprot:gnl/TRDRNA2_/TRDRNA2_151946_c0_seq1.p1 gnl/TRDRNA2_/TRDRNA2_151946_c0~~gnl/TRDRNA2_/TRDRNA2_151946_c0_seq1.p1  ORF type:complete len:449 (-),score=58.54 gnl/TRDRNA2_/TRDRNA2_151946_c0_seq1:98-1321(-)